MCLMDRIARNSGMYWCPMKLSTEVNLDVLPWCGRPWSWSEGCCGGLACFPTQETAGAVTHQLLYVGVYVRPPHCVPAALLHFDHPQVTLVRHVQYSGPQSLWFNSAMAAGEAHLPPSRRARHGLGGMKVDCPPPWQASHPGRRHGGL